MTSSLVDAASTPHARGRDVRGWLVAVACFVAFSLLVVSPLWRMRVQPRWDIEFLFYPVFSLATESVRSGELRLWDPYSNCGVPLVGDPQMPVAAPLAIASALAVDPPSRAFVVFWLAHWVLGGVGAMVLARALGAASAGSFVAAVTYAFSGFFVGHAEHTPYIVSASLLPWVFGLAHGAVERRDVGRALLAGVAGGFATLGGYPAQTMCGGLALGLWLALASGFRESSPAERRARWCWIAAVLGIVGSVTVLAWSPGLWGLLGEAAEYTDRAGPLPIDLATRTSPFVWKAATTFFFPGISTHASRWIPEDGSMTNAYVGALTIPLVLAWATEPGARRRRAWILLFAAVGIWFATGAAGGIRTLAYHALPPLRYFRHNAPFRLHAILALSGAAGAAVTWLVGSPDARRRALRFTTSWAVLAAGLAAVLWPVLVRGSYLRHAAAIFLPPIAVLLAGVVLLWAWGAVGGRVRLETALVLAFVGLFAADMARHVHTNKDTVWYRADTIARLEQRARSERVDPAGPRGVLTSLFNWHQVAHVPMVNGYVPIGSESFDALVQGRFVDVLREARFWLTPTTQLAAPREEGIALLARTGLAEPIPVFVDDERDVLPGPAAPLSSLPPVRVVSYAPERIVLDVDAPVDAVLATTERWAPSWRAHVDDRAVPVLRVNYHFRGVRLPPGRHRVVLTYEPRPWKILVLTSWTMLAGLLCVGSWLSARHRGRAS